MKHSNKDYNNNNASPTSPLVITKTCDNTLEEGTQTAMIDEKPGSITKESGCNAERNHINAISMGLASFKSVTKDNIGPDVNLKCPMSREKLRFPPLCYRCDYSQHKSKEEYEKHCVTNHPKKSGYPGLADIREFGLKAQGMSWEL